MEWLKEHWFKVVVVILSIWAIISFNRALGIWQSKAWVDCIGSPSNVGVTCDAIYKWSPASF